MNIHQLQPPPLKTGTQRFIANLPVLTFSLEELSHNELKRLVRQLFTIDGIDGHAPANTSTLRSNVCKQPLWWPQQLSWTDLRSIANRKRQIRSRFVRENKENDMSEENMRMLVFECYRYFNQLGDVKPCPKSVINLIESSDEEFQETKIDSKIDVRARLAGDFPQQENQSTPLLSQRQVHKNSNYIKTNKLPAPEFKKEPKTSFKCFIGALGLLSIGKGAEPPSGSSPSHPASRGSPPNCNTNNNSNNNNSNNNNSNNNNNNNNNNNGDDDDESYDDISECQSQDSKIQDATDISASTSTTDSIITTTTTELTGQVPSQQDSNTQQLDSIPQIPMNANRTPRKDSVKSCTGGLMRQVSIMSPPKSIQKSRLSSIANEDTDSCHSDTLGQVRCSPSSSSSSSSSSPSSCSAIDADIPSTANTSPTPIPSCSSSSSSTSEEEDEDEAGSNLANIVGKKYEDEYGRFDDGRARQKSENRTLLSIDLCSPLGVNCRPAVQSMKFSVSLCTRGKVPAATTGAGGGGASGAGSGWAVGGGVGTGSASGAGSGGASVGGAGVDGVTTCSGGDGIIVSDGGMIAGGDCSGTASKPCTSSTSIVPVSGSTPSSSTTTVHSTCSTSASVSATALASPFKPPCLYISDRLEHFCLKPMSAYQAKLIANTEVPITYRPTSKGYMDEKDMTFVTFTRKQRRSRIKDLDARSARQLRLLRRSMAVCSVLVDKLDVSRLSDRGTLRVDCGSSNRRQNRFFDQLSAQINKTSKTKNTKSKMKYQRIKANVAKAGIRKNSKSSVIVLSSDDEDSALNARKLDQTDIESMVTSRDRPLQFRCRICQVRISFTLNNRDPVTDHFLSCHNIGNIRLTEAYNEDGTIAMNIVKNQSAPVSKAKNCPRLHSQRTPFNYSQRQPRSRLPIQSHRGHRGLQNARAQPYPNAHQRQLRRQAPPSASLSMSSSIGSKTASESYPKPSSSFQQQPLAIQSLSSSQLLAQPAIAPASMVPAIPPTTPIIPPSQRLNACSQGMQSAKYTVTSPAIQHNILRLNGHSSSLDDVRMSGGTPQTRPSSQHNLSGPSSFLTMNSHQRNSLNNLQLHLQGLPTSRQSPANNQLLSRHQQQHQHHLKQIQLQHQQQQTRLNSSINRFSSPQLNNSPNNANGYINNFSPVNRGRPPKMRYSSPMATQHMVNPSPSSSSVSVNSSPTQFATDVICIE